MNKEPIRVTYSRVDDDPFEEGYVYAIHIHDINDDFYVTFNTEATDKLMDTVIYAYMQGRMDGTCLLKAELGAAIELTIRNIDEEMPNLECSGSYSINGEPNE